MTNVSFEEETYRTPQGVSKKENGLLDAVMAMGFAKDEKEASTVLLWSAAAGCVLAAGLFIWMFVNQPKGLNESDIERIIQLQQQ